VIGPFRLLVGQSCVELANARGAQQHAVDWGIVARRSSTTVGSGYAVSYVGSLPKTCNYLSTAYSPERLGLVA